MVIAKAIKSLECLNHRSAEVFWGISCEYAVI